MKVETADDFLPKIFTIAWKLVDLFEIYIFHPFYVKICLSFFKFLK